MGPVQEDGELKQFIDFEKYKRSYYTKNLKKNIQMFVRIIYVDYNG